MKFGVIGCGKQAPKHISGLKSAGVDGIVVTDSAPEAIERLTAADPALEAVSSVDALLADPAVAGVSICTPTPSHAPLIRRCIAANKHFLCEKPLCEDVADAEALIEAAERAGLVGMVGFVYRFVPAFEVAREILGDVADTGRSPVLGRVTNAFLRIGGRGSHALWKHRAATGGGAVNEMMVHMIDLAQWLFGPPVEAELLKSALRWPKRVIGGQMHDVDADDWALALLRSENGVEALLQADMITPAFTQYLEIQGENGSFFGSIQTDLPSFVFCIEPRGKYYAGRTEIPAPSVNLFEKQMGAFVAAVAGGQAPERGALRDSLSVMKAMQRMSAGAAG